MEIRRPGRPAKIAREDVIDIFLKNKEIIYNKERKTISKKSTIWEDLSSELGEKISPRSLYSMACNKVIIQKLFPLENQDSLMSSDDLGSEQDISEINKISSEVSQCLNNSDTLGVTRGFAKFNLYVPREEFGDLIEVKFFKRHDAFRKKKYTRFIKRLKYGLWQNWLTNELWKQAKIKCGFNFHYHHVNTDATCGTTKGTCNCGGEIACKFTQIQERIQIECSYKEGEGKCGKRYLRNPIRTELAKELKIRSAMVARSETADQLMEEGDFEPPHLYSLNILHKAKQEIIASEYVHKDPLMALSFLKVGSLQGSIHNIGMDPFYVHFWSSHQLHVYRSSMRSGHVTLSIDATGGIVRKIVKPNGSISNNIFLYNTVASTEHNHYPLFHMLSESHNTNAITFWIGEWCRMNIPVPKEIVCDSSKALLTAIVRAFTGFLTIEDYANALIHLKLHCYVRLDVAHFIKMYVNFLKDIKSKAVKTLYLSCIGQMILCEDVESAADILLSILIISRCKTNGKLINGQDTQCTTHKKKLKQFLDPKNDETEANSDINLEETIFDSTEYHNEWSKWAIDIDIQARNIASTENGDDDNAHYFPELADRLINDMKWLPLWSSIYRIRFGFGRHPATSAPSEIEFNLVKNHVFKLFPKPVRADVFVETYVKYLSGKIKIIDASIKLLKDDQCSEKQQDLKEVQQLIKEKTQVLNDITNARVCEDNISNRDTNDEAISASISALEEIENWRGLASERSKTKSRYLQRNPETYDKIMLPSENEKLTKIPIMKNGNNPYLQAVKYKNKEYSFTNTCAFDSLVQIFLVGVCDNPHLRELFMGLKESMKFAELVIYIMNKGVGQHAYRLRADILIDLFKTTTHTSLMQNKYIVNCESNVVTLVCNIFGEFPSIQESTTCNEGCPPKIRNVRVVSVDPSFMTTSAFQNILSELASVEPRPCSRKEGCSGTAQTTLAHTGKIVFVEPIDFGLEQPSLILEKIGKQFKNPCDVIQNNTNFQFLGLVDYKNPPITTRRSNDAVMGHYTAITLRNINFYYEYNDLIDKPKKILSNFKSHPHLLVYLRM